MALEWLKTVLGDTYTEDIDKQVSTEIGKAFVPKADFNVKNEALKTANATIADRDGQLEKLKGIDTDKLQAEITRLQGENTTAKANYESQLAAVQFDARLDTAILSHKGRNAKAIKAMLDIDALSKSQNQDSDISTALEALAKDSGYMFEATPAATAEDNSQPTGGIRINSAAQHAAGGTPDYNNMSDSEYYAATMKKQ